MPFRHIISSPSTAPAACRSLLVLLNPNAGARQGRRVFQRVVPLFKAAGIRLAVKETKRPAHAHVMAAGLTAEQLRAIDGACAAAVMGFSS